MSNREKKSDEDCKRPNDSSRKQFRDLLRSSVAIDFNSSNITKGEISRWKKVMDSTNDFFWIKRV